jgi:hypothetical protein
MTPARISYGRIILIFLAACVLEGFEAGMQGGGYAPWMAVRTLVHTACLFAALPLGVRLLRRVPRRFGGIPAEAASVAVAAFICACAGQFTWGIVASKLRWFFRGEQAFYLFDTLTMTSIRLMTRRLELPFLLAFAPLMLFRLGAVRHGQRDVELDGARIDARLSEARLHLLRMQLNPHFVFNALNSIATLLRHDRVQARVMLERLSRFYAFTVETEGRPLVTVREEIGLVREYLEIESVRFGPRLSVAVEVSEEAMSCHVPTLILQPLVENAIKHGISIVRGPGWLRIDVRRDGTRLRMTVENGGGEARARIAREGVGFANTQRRLRHLYGGDYELTIIGAATSTRVTMVIPVRMRLAEVA